MNKKVRILAIINIVQAVLLIAAIVTAIFILPDIMLFDNSDSLPAVVVQGSENDIYNGYADVTAYGAVADDEKDDTDAFIAAAKTGAGVYVPFGTFDIKNTVNLKGQNLKGAGLDRTVIRFNGEGTIVKLSGAALIDDLTLTFNEVSGNEKEGEKVALLDDGLTMGSMIRSVKTVNVGTGFYAPNASKNDSVVTVESFIVDKFSYKAICIKKSNSMIFRAVNVREAIGDIDSAVTLGGSFTIETLHFSMTQAKFPLEIIGAQSAIVKGVLFDSVTAKSGSLLRCDSSTFSMQMVTVKGSKASNFVKIDDSADGSPSSGDIITLYSDSGILTVDEQNVIRCQNNISQ